MKKIMILIAFAILVNACDWVAPEGKEFDSNLKTAKVISTNNGFGLALFNQILENEDKSNVMISPASISLALGMAYNGAGTTTLDAFDMVLNYEGLTPVEVNEISRDLMAQLIIDTKGNLLEIANSIWYREGFPVYKSFLDINSSYFNAEIRELDFSAPTAVETINNWVSENTHEKIEQIIDQLSPESMMVLINALYFNCIWEYEFDPDETIERMFYNEDMSEYGNVEMMKTESTFKYAATDDFTGVALPYKDEKFSMYLLLPAIGEGVDDLSAQLNGSNWNIWLSQFSLKEEVQVTLPKFRFDYDRTLVGDLDSMGLGIAFTDEADFSGISEIDLLISDIIHKTYIDVNEEGTEAAAVTAIVFEITSVGIDGPVLIEFTRPFLFAIIENSSKSIVFVGKVEAPAYE